jgi:hypothetical protein
MIYEETFHFQDGVHISFRTRHAGERCARTYGNLKAFSTDNMVLGITKTFKQLRAESLDRLQLATFFSQNKFILHLEDLKYKTLSKPSGPCTGALYAFLGVDAISCIRHIDLRIGDDVLGPVVTLQGTSAITLSLAADANGSMWNSAIKRFQRSLHVPVELDVIFGAQCEVAEHSGVLWYKIPFPTADGDATKANLEETLAAEKQRLEKAHHEGDHSAEDYTALLETLQLCHTTVQSFASNLTGDF